MNIQNEIQKALQHYNSGDYRQAKEVCKRILKEQPKNAEVLYFLGVVYSHLGDKERAVKYIKESLALHPDNPDGYHLVGMSFQEMGKLDEAEEYYRKTLQYNPGYAEAYNNLANVLKERGQTDEAIRNFKKAIALKPASSILHYNLGVIYQEQRDIENAIQSYKNALQHDPKNKKILLMLGDVLQQKGQIYGSRESLQEAERIYYDMVQSQPSDYSAHTNLGKILQDQGRHAEAIACYRKALELNPCYDEAHFSLADALHETGSVDDSILHYQRAVEFNPKFIDAYNNLGVVLSESNRLDEAISSFENALRLDSHSVKSARAFSNLGNILSELGEAGEAEQHYRQALSADPSLSKVNSNLLLAMNYNPRYDASEVFSEHLNYANRFAEPHYRISYSYKNDKNSNRRLLIGYLSPDLRCHSVAYFIEPVIAAHDRDLFEVFCYSDVEKPDEFTGRIKNLASQWRDVSRLTDELIYDMIRDDSIDILVDLTGHTAKNRLLVFARKPAPVQVSWIGYPSTAGLKTIDYKIADRYTDPPGESDQYYTERLLRLPDCFSCYLPEKDAPEVQPAPVLRNGYITFGSFNNLAKVSEEIAVTWVGILKALPTSRFILKAKGLISARAKKDWTEFFQSRGIAENRIELHSPIPTAAQHLAFYDRVDIALDTFPYNGATTTCEALWMGVPVVTLAGKTHASRVGVSILSNVGLTGLIADSADDYKRIATGLANNFENLASLRNSLRGMMQQSPLTDAKKFTTNLEKAYRDMWLEWCGKE